MSTVNVSEIQIGPARNAFNVPYSFLHNPLMRSAYISLPLHSVLCYVYHLLGLPVRVHRQRRILFRREEKPASRLPPSGAEKLVASMAPSLPPAGPLRVPSPRSNRGVPVECTCARITGQEKLNAFKAMF